MLSQITLSREIITYDTLSFCYYSSALHFHTGNPQRKINGKSKIHYSAGG